MKQNNLIAYAASFVSFLIDTMKTKSIERIMLFGSVARDDFDEESDIDLFIDTKENIEQEVERVHKLFMMSQVRKTWELKGLKHELSLKVGSLNEWRLKRSIISDGILLYGKMREMPENAEYYLLFQPSFQGLPRNRQLRIWRKLYGYQQKVGKKVYKSKSLIESLNGKRIESSILIPAQREKEILEFLRKHRVRYTLHELWSDSF